MKFPVFDLHCDTAYALLGESLRECGNLRENKLHIDLNRASKFPGYAQCFACYTTPLEDRILPVELFEREMVTVMREVEKNNDLIAIAYSARDIQENYANGIMSAILTIEGTAGLDYDSDLLPMLYQVGFRMTTLGWNEKNPLAGSHVTGGGLTEQGKLFVKAAQDVGMIIDVSHISDEAFWDVIDISTKPIVASHSNSRACCYHSRNITDEMFQAIMKTGGVVGINLYDCFVGKDSSLQNVCDHILHFMELDPEIEHIALGADFDGCDSLVRGCIGIQDYDHLAECLQNRGVSDEAIMNIFWNNALGVFEKCCI